MSFEFEILMLDPYQELWIQVILSPHSNSIFPHLEVIFILSGEQPFSSDPSWQSYSPSHRFYRTFILKPSFQREAIISNNPTQFAKMQEESFLHIKSFPGVQVLGGQFSSSELSVQSLLPRKRLSIN